MKQIVYSILGLQKIVTNLTSTKCMIELIFFRSNNISLIVWILACPYNTIICIQCYQRGRASCQLIQPVMLHVQSYMVLVLARPLSFMDRKCGKHFNWKINTHQNTHTQTPFLHIQYSPAH